MCEKPFPFAAGFPTDWQIRPANYIQLDWLAYTRNFIHIWLPEGVSTGHNTALFILSEETDFHFTRLASHQWVHTFEKPGVLSLRGECRGIIPDARNGGGCIPALPQRTIMTAIIATVFSTCQGQ